MRDFPEAGTGLYRFARKLAAAAAKSLLHTEYDGLGNIPQKGPLVLCCNHRSCIDPCLLAIPIRRPVRFMAKSELFTDHGKLIGYFLRKFGAFPVRRGKGDRRSLRTAVQILKSGGIVGIFPQGKITPEGTPFCAKPGAALAAALGGAAVLPAAVCCRGPVKLFSRVRIRFGPLLDSRVLFPESVSPDSVRRAAEIIADRINLLLEDKT